MSERLWVKRPNGMWHITAGDRSYCGMLKWDAERFAGLDKQEEDPGIGQCPNCLISWNRWEVEGSWVFFWELGLATVLVNGHWHHVLGIHNYRDASCGLRLPAELTGPRVNEATIWRASPRVAGDPRCPECVAATDRNAKADGEEPDADLH